MRPDFLAAAARPFLRSQSTADSMSPSVSVRAFLQSIMPAPVLSRRSFTRAAVIAAMFLFSCVGSGGGGGFGFYVGEDLGRQVFAGADVGAGGGHFGADPVQHRAGNQVAVQGDGADGVVVAGDWESDAGGVGVAVEDRDNRDV